ncbi:DUF1176 domain-containing protein [Sphingomonas psychrotolerans]|uniref:DUF1176 domain-containing protein n=1 Tax=Sphingomonas psychrotolerans TaxID=1327635 RepID=UPI00130534E2|nr:DUF1176 domain-containing protein [Sphingomonas psychrotolerans]
MTKASCAGSILPLLATAILSVAASPPRDTVQSYDTYGSWFVACDNTLTCITKGFPDRYQGSEIRIERDAGPRGSLSASISATHKFALTDIRIDGQPAGLAGPAWEITTSDDETTATTDNLEVIRALVLKLRSASKVTLAEGDEVPLDGFAAAILRLDDRQHRGGGVTALLRTGEKPASQVPAPPALPRIPNRPVLASFATGEEQRLIRAVRANQKALFEKEGCGETPEMPEAHALDDSQALVLIPCIMGAYQGSSLAFIAPRRGGAARRLIAPTPYLSNGSDRSDAAYFTEGAFDAKTGTLSMAAKGRGLADCGVSASWIWDGRSFLLSEMTLQQSCGGIEPGDWPILFRSVR